MAEPTDSSQVPEPPRIDGYRIVRVLGRGGMGIVYLAEQTLLKRQVALKAMTLTKLSEPEALERFLGEARALARLGRHEHLVQVYDVVTDWSGRYYIVMEYVEGRSLDSVLEGGPPLGTRDAVRIVRDAALALHHAHERGIIHRDIKPANIMLASGRDVRVMDFGLARSDLRPTLTQSGMVFGTPTYMSPEQLRGDRDLDRRSDVYSLCVVLYHLICGEPPFDGDNAYAIGIKHLNEQPRPPRTFWPTLSPRLEAIILQGMLKNPAERFASAADLARALDDFLAAESPRAGSIPPTPAAPPPSSIEASPSATDVPVALSEPTPRPAPASSRARRSNLLPIAFAGAAVVLLAVAVGGGWAFARWKAARDDDSATAQDAPRAGTRARPAADDEDERRVDVEPAPAEDLTPIRLPGDSQGPVERVRQAPRFASSPTRAYAGPTMVLCVAADATRGRFLTGDYESRVGVWNVADGRAITAWTGHANVVTGLALSPDGATLATASADGSVRFLGAEDGMELRTEAMGRAAVDALAWSPDGHLLAVGLRDGEIALVDPAVEGRRALRESPGPSPRAMAFAPDGASLVVADTAGTITRYHADGRENPGVFAALAGDSVRALAFLDDGSLAGVTRGGTVVVWNADGTEARRWSTAGGEALSLALEPGAGGLLATGHRDGTIALSDPRSGTVVETLRAHSAPVTGLAFAKGDLVSVAGGRTAAGRDAGEVLVWRREAAP